MIFRSEQQSSAEKGRVWKESSVMTRGWGVGGGGGGEVEVGTLLLCDDKSNVIANKL